MNERNKMLCPDCGIEMNRHAEKVNFSTHPAENDPAFGGTLEEIHCCPKCGKTAARSVR